MMRYRFGHLLLFLTAFAVAFGAVPAKKAPVRKGPAPKATAKSAPKGKAAARPVAGKKGVATRPGRPVATGLRASRQTQPTPDRYREIQQALVDKGYLHSEPNGVWDADSMAALKQFQTDKNLSPTGKLSSQSLIGLGLGPKTAGPLVLPRRDGTMPNTETTDLPETPTAEPVKAEP
jgi:hypothetical protein